MSELIPNTLTASAPPQDQVPNKAQVDQTLIPATVTKSINASSELNSETVNADKQTLIRLTLQGTQYQLATQAKLELALRQNNAQLQVMLKTEDARALAQGQTEAKLTLLGQSIQISLPGSLQLLANKNGVSDQQLQSLAQRTQGYPLGITQSQGNKLSFENGTSISLDSKLQLPKGSYIANIAMQGTQLILKLTSVQGEISIQLAPKESPSLPVNNNQILLTKNEPVQILNQWLKKLEATPFSASTEQGKTNITLPSLTNTSQSKGKLATDALIQQGLKITKAEVSNNIGDELSSKQTESKTNQSAGLSPTVTLKDHANSNHTNNGTPLLTKGNIELAPMDVLQKALSKAGAMPERIQKTSNDVNNMASQLLKSLPQLATMPLSQYADPHLLQAQLTSFSALNLAHSPLTSPAPLTGEAITTLFQLLLGFKASSNGQTVSNKLTKHLQQLSLNMQVRMTQGLLGALDKGASLDSMAQLATSLALYQQASTDPNQNSTWYFALPYSINQRDEQLEGKFERDKPDENDPKKVGWRLQLKFNLSQGSIVINANRQGKSLGLKFTANNEELLKRVTQFQSPLSQKMAQIGFELNDFSTQLGTIPATLLPGDHYLVKTRA
ncbi:hypothetical protein [Shewanella sp. SR44-3]|uniref:hypothetical protein n=1 Tax=Shewanella sp. SR44-3 TaxID=2760936 RepID=UPI0015F95C27|nr:hypothetical protein [Shewanella sp. SR44-3]MBB1268054.1 hypothetical protein [Shewanella sp. SR44-3]